MQPNWFVAWPVTVDPTFVIPEPPPGVRVFHPADRHVTAAFLGPCGEEAARQVLEATTAVRGPVSRGTFASVEALGPPDRPTALGALIDHGNDELADVIGGHRDAWLALAGRPPARYGVLPHCTIARPTRRATDAQRAAAVAWGTSLATVGVGFELRPLALYTWAHDRQEQLFRIVG